MGINRRSITVLPLTPRSRAPFFGQALAASLLAGLFFVGTWTGSAAASGSGEAAAGASSHERARACAKPPGGRRSHSPAPTASPTPSASPAAGPSPSPAADAAGTAAGSDLPANATPAPSPEPAFIQAYEAAYVQFLQEKYDEARDLLDKADSIQPGQPSSVSLRNQIFKHFYGDAYLAYASKDYDGAVKQLDAADKVMPNQADSNNMRGLIFSRQKNYPAAEEMFKKSIAQDSTFWEAKFNLAELPFIYRNYTAARGRFEELFSQTDPAKQPKEAELTEFKVFLTLLLEGKEPAARAFMERFTFSGATPARYYCQAALDFYHGDQDKALGWISSAKKEYPAKLEGIFAQSFFRVGWLTDANAAALVKATPSTEPLPANSPAVAAATPTPAASPAEVAMASPSKSPSTAAAAGPKASASPALVAMASPAKSPAVAAVTPVPSASPAVAAAAPKASASPIEVAMASPSPRVLDAAAAVPKASPTPKASAAPAVSAASPAVSASAAPVVASDRLTVPTPTAAPVAASVAPKPVPSATVAAAAPSPSAADASPAAAASADDGISAGDVVAIGIVLLVLGQTVFTVFIVMRALKDRQTRLAKKPLRYSGQTAVKPQEAQIP